MTNEIEKVRTTCFNSGQRIKDHFVDVTDMVGRRVTEVGLRHVEAGNRVDLMEYTA